MICRTVRTTPFPYTTLFRSHAGVERAALIRGSDAGFEAAGGREIGIDGYDARIARENLHRAGHRSEEHTSELQSHHDLVCRLLLEKKNNHHLTQHSASENTE